MLLSACEESSPAAPSTVPEGGSGGGTSATLQTVASTVSGRTVSVPIDGTSPLANAGSAAATQTSIGRFLIAHAVQGTFNVMTATCTHEACTIDGFSNSRFMCPCHGSQFSNSGAVLVGPAPTPLPTFASSFANGVLTFTA